jgi:hypothetical protein
MDPKILKVAGAKTVKIKVGEGWIELKFVLLIMEYYMGKYHCTVDSLFDWFELVYFANKNKKLSVVIQLIPNQSNRRSMVQ